MSLINFVLIALATYRLTRLVISDAIFESTRNRIWKKYPPESSKIGYLFTCPWCVSIWIGSALQLSYTIIPNWTTNVEIVLSASAVAGLLTAHEDRD